MLVSSYQTTRRQNPNPQNINIRRRRMTSNVGQNSACLSKIFNAAVTMRSILLYTSILKMINFAVDGVQSQASPREICGG